MATKTYTKHDVAVRVAQQRDARIHTAEQWTDEVFKALSDVLMRADPDLRIEIRNFGVFEVKLTKAKPKARNPRTGEQIVVPARRKTHFKPGKLLREFLRQPLHEATASSESPRTDDGM
jgi:integration host factor subunit beta